MTHGHTARSAGRQMVRPAAMSDRKVATLVLLRHNEIHDEKGPVRRRFNPNDRINGT
jgi:hypothetical protein